MDFEMTPDDIRRAEFRTTLRGFDRVEVESLLASIARQLEEMQADNAKLASAAAELSDRDLEHEFETVGREVTSILQAAREAADSMRERAAVEAASWRSEATEEAETNRREAAADAEALRRDAWITGSEMLSQAANQAKRMREQADRDVLTIQGEAEREAHRLTSSARRDAEDLLRSATMDAEKTTSEAAKRRDDIIDQASRQAAAAQERTRALEQRRDELMEELENVRSTLSRLEGSLEEKRETHELSPQESTSVRIVPTPLSEDPEHWELGETVRVVRPDDEEPKSVIDIDLPSEDLMSETAIEPLPEPRPVVEVVPAPQKEPEEAEPPKEVEEATEAPAESDEVAEPQGAEDIEDVDALFESLREGGHPATEDAPPEIGAGDEGGPEAGSVGEEEAEEGEPESRDWIEVRDARLLPITNRALRGTKKSLTELQNVALDSLRTDDDWRLSPEVVAETLQAELISVWAESFAAGHSVAEEMTGSKITRPPTPAADSVPEFAEVLAEAVKTALDESGEGQRARQAAASRVFRVWRTDEAERRIRELAIRSYQVGIERSVGAEAPVV